MKIALAQLNFIVGDFEFNQKKIEKAILSAKKDGASLVVFPELAVCGYPSQDLLERKSFIEKCEQSVDEIAKLSTDIGIILGAPSKNQGVGKKLFNSAYYLTNGRIEQVIHKGLLPTYDIFDEYRYFQPSKNQDIIVHEGKKIALTICEDVWDVEEFGMYQFCPMDVLSKKDPSLIINIAASPFNFEQEERRLNVFKRNVEKYGLPILYVNHVGAQTDLIFDGGSLFMNKNGELIKQAPHFEESVTIAETDSISRVEEKVTNPLSKYERIEKAIILGVRDYFSKSGFQKAIVGLSGGIDSAVTLCLACEALGPENIMALLMPSPFSTQHSVVDSEALCNTLNCNHTTIPIENTFKAFNTSLEGVFNNKPFDVTEENIQARIRGTLLMAYSNKFGHILLNTSNKSEMAVGYGTLYGDMCGGLSVLGDLYKTEVYEIANFINRNKQVIPQNIITKPPSAELRPDQKDSDSLPDYGVLDKVLYQHIEKRKNQTQLIEMGFESAVVKKAVYLVGACEYKRYQAPPILRVSEKSFGRGRRYPIVGKF